MSSTRRSPPTRRVIDVLDHLLAHPDRAFGLSELARDVGISKPTCLGIATTLTELGWLQRDADARTYAIGPALVAAGSRAHEHVTGLEGMNDHLRALATKFDATCSASAVVGDEIVVLASVRPDGSLDGPGVGARYPFAPPIGLMYVIWDADEAFERWLARTPTLPIALDRKHLRTVVTECRDRGYLVEGLTTVGRRLHTLLAGVAAHDLPDEVRDLVGEMASTLGERVYLNTELAGRGKVATNVLAAPTYRADGRQHLVVTLAVGDAISGSEIARRGRALIATTAVMTADGGGLPKRTRGVFR